jgi:hypothetical protein
MILDFAVTSGGRLDFFQGKAPNFPKRTGEKVFKI